MVLNRRYFPYLCTFYSSLFCSLGAALFTDFQHFVTGIDWKSLIFFCLISLISGLIPTVLYVYGMQHIETGDASLLSTTELITGSIVSMTFLGEPLSCIVIVGIIIIILGMLVMNCKKNRKNLKAFLSP